MSRDRRSIDDEAFLICRSVATQFVVGAQTGRHRHAWGQLIYASAGVMTVWTERGSWVAPQQWAIWVPAAISHEIQFAGQASLRTLYLRPDAAANLPPDCTVFSVSPLLRELILRAALLRMLDSREPMEAALLSLILSELIPRDASPFDLPSPVSTAARRAADILSAEGRALNTDVLASRVGLSARSLERRFRRETGMTVGSWGRQARMLQSLRLLAAGQPVKAAAQAAGYRTPSAFVAAFRAAFGKTPGRYFSAPAGPG